LDLPHEKKLLFVQILIMIVKIYLKGSLHQYSFFLPSEISFDEGFLLFNKSNKNYHYWRKGSKNLHQA